MFDHVDWSHALANLALIAIIIYGCHQQLLESALSARLLMSDAIWCGIGVHVILSAAIWCGFGVSVRGASIVIYAWLGYIWCHYPSQLPMSIIGPAFPWSRHICNFFVLEWYYVFGVIIGTAYRHGEAFVGMDHIREMTISAALHAVAFTMSLVVVSAHSLW